MRVREHVFGICSFVCLVKVESSILNLESRQRGEGVIMRFGLV